LEEVFALVVDGFGADFEALDQLSVVSLVFEASVDDALSEV